MTDHTFRATLLAAVVASLCAAGTAQAQTATDEFDVLLTVTSVCDVSTTAPTDMDFGSQDSLATNIPAQSTISLTCTPNTGYTVGLDGGGSGNTAARVMTDGTNTVGYQLYTDLGHSDVWGNTSADWVSGAGNGAQQTYTVFGLVPSANVPASSYNDTINVTVTY